MERKKLEKAYEEMMYKYGEYDVFEDDIEPNFQGWTLAELKAHYNEDKKYYESREKAGGYWG